MLLSVGREVGGVHLFQVVDHCGLSLAAEEGEVVRMEGRALGRKACNHVQSETAEGPNVVLRRSAEALQQELGRKVKGLSVCGQFLFAARHTRRAQHVYEETSLFVVKDRLRSDSVVALSVEVQVLQPDRYLS